MANSQLLLAVLRAVMQGQPLAVCDPHYPRWHLAPVSGLMNDPNGFIQYNGQFHLFYQWNPLACNHHTKIWGHWRSADLLHWQHEKVALLPDTEYDRNGCYSGSAVVYNGKLTLFYTGNVKFTDGTRTAWQCMAVENSAGGFDKKAPVLAQPAGYSGHVRDPKVWYHRPYWYMTLAAQDLQQCGKVLLLRSENLTDWKNLGELAGSGAGGLADAGYMWECPDLFYLGGQHILLCCPQGLPKEEKRWLNIHCCGWLSGTLNYHNGYYSHGVFHELDSGFEFYAPQTTEAEDGRRLLFGWLGVPGGEEMYQPTMRYGWLHQMTCPRELFYHNDTLCQRPVTELQQLRSNEQRWQGLAGHAPALCVKSLELQITLDGVLTVDFANTLILQVNNDGLQLSRRSLINNEWQHRYWQGSVHQLHILCDRSSVEIFINQGQGVMSSRYFPEHPAIMRFHGTAALQLHYWLLRACMIE